MSILLEEKDLPADLTVEQAVEAAYASELAECTAKLLRGLPVLIECDKDLAPWLYVHVRSRLKNEKLQCVYLDGRVEAQGGMNGGVIGAMMGQLRDVVRGAVEKRVIVLPHLDLLTTTQGALTNEAREAIPLLYENPELVWLGFKDPSFPIPDVIQNLFPHRITLLGVSRSRLKCLVTQSESRKFGKQFNPWVLYKYVSGVNAVRLRKLLSTLEGEDYPADAKHIWRQLRQATLGATLEVPDIDLDKDIGGYAKVKKRLRQEILDVLRYKDEITEEDEVAWLEELIPKGMIFLGPPGTGKTLFAKAMATAIGAAVTIVSGPELKSRWVGESEERIRRIFQNARHSAPSIIVFDELDAFASARGTYTGSGVEHSMVNQLLTEMDGFYREELVFVVGTTNFPEALDPALLRPGRFEFQFFIPYPDAEDRREILQLYDRKMKLHLTEEGLEFAVKRTTEQVPGAALGTLFSGDHLNALCRSIARMRLRREKGVGFLLPERPEGCFAQKEPDPFFTTPDDVERALSEWIERPNMTATEKKVVATHEAGHAVCALFCEHSPAIERISIEGDAAGMLGFVRYQDPAHRYVVTRSELLDDLCVLMGGREAEALLLDDISIGAAEDLRRATHIARAIVEQFGMGGDEVGVGVFRADDGQGNRREQLSTSVLEKLDGRMRELLEEARQRSANILHENRAVLEALRDELLTKGVVEAQAIGAMTAKRPAAK